MSPTTSTYGSWPSPIAAADVARAGHPVGDARFVGGEAWWSELSPAEGGRIAVRRLGAEGAPVDVLRPPWNARTRVHEYGGGSWTATDHGALVFAEFTDQRLYRLDPGAEGPVAITPEPPRPVALRYGELAMTREGDCGVVRPGDPRRRWRRPTRHLPGAAGRFRCRGPVTGPLRRRRIALPGQSRGCPPDGRRLAWVAWNHPQMPWDGTELRVGELAEDGSVHAYRTVLGSTTESILQPEWVDDDTLYLLSDRSNWWNIYRLRPDDGPEPEPLHPVEADMGAPMWQLGYSFYRPLADGRVLVLRTLGNDRLGVLDPATGRLDDIALPGFGVVRLADVHDGRVLLRCGGPTVPPGLRELELDTGELTDVRLGVDGPSRRRVPRRGRDDDLHRARRS